MRKVRSYLSIVSVSVGFALGLWVFKVGFRALIGSDNMIREGDAFDAIVMLIGAVIVLVLNRTAAIRQNAISEIQAEKNSNAET